jgi:hypothetical protein
LGLGVMVFAGGSEQRQKRQAMEMLAMIKSLR